MMLMDIAITPCTRSESLRQLEHGTALSSSPISDAIHPCVSMCIRGFKMINFAQNEEY